MIDGLYKFVGTTIQPWTYGGNLRQEQKSIREVIKVSHFSSVVSSVLPAFYHAQRYLTDIQIRGDMLGGNPDE